MNMLDGLSDLEGNALAKVLRRTIVSAAHRRRGGRRDRAAALGCRWAALGLVIGLGHGGS